MRRDVLRVWLVMPLVERCYECEREFAQKADELLCPKCKRIEDILYANDPTPAPEDEPARTFSRTEMRDRLGVTGNVDE